MLGAFLAAGLLFAASAVSGRGRPKRPFRRGRARHPPLRSRGARLGARDSGADADPHPARRPGAGGRIVRSPGARGIARGGPRCGGPSRLRHGPPRVRPVDAASGDVAAAGGESAPRPLGRGGARRRRRRRVDCEAHGREEDRPLRLGDRQATGSVSTRRSIPNAWRTSSSSTPSTAGRMATPCSAAARISRTRRTPDGPRSPSAPIAGARRRRFCRPGTSSIPLEGADKSAWRDPAVADAYVAAALDSDPDGRSREPRAFRAPSGAMEDSFYLATGRSLWDASLVLAPTLVLASERDFWSRPADRERLRAELVHAPARLRCRPSGRHPPRPSRPRRSGPKASTRVDPRLPRRAIESEHGRDPGGARRRRLSDAHRGGPRGHRGVPGARRPALPGRGKDLPVRRRRRARSSSSSPARSRSSTKPATSRRPSSCITTASSPARSARLTGARALVSAVARGDTEAYEISQSTLREILNVAPDMGDVILQAFIARRQMLRESRRLHRPARHRLALLEGHVPHPRLPVANRSSSRGWTSRTTPAVDAAARAVRRDARRTRRWSRAAARCCSAIPTTPRSGRRDRHPAAAREVVYDLAVVGRRPGGLAAAVYGASRGAEHGGARARRRRAARPARACGSRTTSASPPG